MQDPSKIKVIQVLEATTGGTRRHLYDLVTHLNPQRFDVAVVAAVRRDSGFQQDMEDFRARGITVQQLDMVRAISPFRDVQALVKLWRCFRHLGPDIVHTHSAKAGILGRVAARLAGVPTVIHTPHHFPFEMDVSNTRKCVYLWIERVAARLTDRIVCVCEHERLLALERRVARPEKLVVIDNGIEAPAPARQADVRELRRGMGVEENEVAVGIVGRLSAQKGHDILFEAVARMASQGERFKVVVVGDGERRGKLVEQIDRLGVADKVIMLGHYDEPQGLYEAFDVVVIPSRWEALPYVLLDAMATGRPVVVSDAGGMGPAVRQAKAGRVVPVADPDALAAALVDMLENPLQREQFGKNARDYSREHAHLDTMIDRLAALYEQSWRDKTDRKRGTGT